MKRVLTIKLREVLNKENMTQMQLSELAGVRQAAISAMCRNKNEIINIKHLERIANALNIEDINELLVLENVEDRA